MKQRALAALSIFIALVAAVTGCDRSQPPAVSRQTQTTDGQQPATDLQLALETRQLLEAADAPQRDLVDLVARFGGSEEPLSRVARAKPWGFEIGDSHLFWVQDKGTGEYRQEAAALLHETPHAYWFVAEGLKLDESSLLYLAEAFEEQIYPTNQRVFGREWSPGVDGDPHLVILLSGDLGGGVSAYQNSLDELPRQVFPFSNEMEMITLSANSAALDDPAVACDLAHEFQHVIQWATDRDEATWLNEVFGLLACPLNGLKAGYHDLIVEAFAVGPDLQLNAWGTEPALVAAQYGASQLFGAYFLERFGERGVQILAAETQSGLRSVDSALRELNAGMNGDELFADWVVANYLDDPGLEDGRYGYRDLDLPAVRPELTIGSADLPLEHQGDVNQYAADYIVLEGPGEFQIDFNRQALVRPVPAEPHSGDMVWWGGREQESDAMLSRAFDLSDLDKATLTFYTWYDIEAGYDYAYVAVSADGRQWTALPGQTTSAGTVTSVAFAPGYTGRSRGWVQERIDLTPHAGQKVQVRFEYVTDDGPVRPGFLVDDIEIPELGYRHDAETNDDGWVASGFLRLANILPQGWLLQLVSQRGDQVSIERLSPDLDNSGRWQIALGPGETAALIISGITRDTAETASYRLEVSGPAD